jgi:nitrate/nitrite transport system ATP-binding protein
MSFLVLDRVSKGYGAGRSHTPVLQDVSLTVQEGEFVAIVGYSGAGKTTLISLVAGLLAPDAGTITLEGQPITGPGPERGVVFQNYSLLPWLSAHDNVHLAVDQLYRDWSPARKREWADRFLDLVKLGHARDKRPHELSGGMRQRVAVARALAMNPRVMLLDEPLGALDALTRATLQDEIERIYRSERKTILLITNDVDEAILLADRIVPLSAGPAARLGPEVRVDLPRPRDRKALARDPRFRAVRNQVLAYLLGPGSRRARAGGDAPSDGLGQDERSAHADLPAWSGDRGPRAGLPAWGGTAA